MTAPARDANPRPGAVACPDGGISRNGSEW